VKLTPCRWPSAILLLAVVALAWEARGQTEGESRPLPDIPALMHQVEDHQKAAETLVQDYLYHSHAIEQTLDKHGNVKKTEIEDSEIFYVAGTRIRRMTRKDGKDLSADEQAKEAKRIDKEIAKAKKKQSRSNDEERDVVTVSRFLELGSFTNARRVAIEGRDTIAVDFTGNPKAKTHTSFEGALREMEGTVWVDEQDRSLRKLQGHFVNDFKVGGGLLADVRKGSNFEAAFTKVNDEVWLPAIAAGRGDVRIMLLLNIHGSLQVTNSSYRKFKATATILPGANTGSEP